MVDQILQETNLPRTLKLAILLALAVAIPGGISYGILQYSVSDLKAQAETDQAIALKREEQLQIIIKSNQDKNDAKFDEVLRSLGRLEGKLDGMRQ